MGKQENFPFEFKKANPERTVKPTTEVAPESEREPAPEGQLELDEFRGMDIDELRNNITTQETRLASRVVDEDERDDVRKLIWRMQARVAEMERNQKKA